ncbi:CPBP family intramembrane metalloprotease [Luteimonas sp. BDR2-5]|uniref:CPBP family intramembrane glutamic endopeptidase n=1 Tax=Proluteimonas luteida TaxID=2878685 RepID=UPI001E632AB4|nr:CPBP family intramembrane glutamic endopeptidase [Luteimonas sp. BDR2-5]MCD9028687.1 CPBP family intramembrane metalloprotease [Luteimonas sp. BDR2-5]
MRWHAIGWRLAVVAAVVVAVLRAIMALSPPAYDALQRLLAGAAFSLLALVALCALLRTDPRSRGAIAMAGTGANLRAFAGGVLLWLLPAAIGTALCIAMGWVRISFVGALPDLPARLALLALTVLLVEALPEELLFRGYVQSLLGTRVARWLAVVLQAVLFCLCAWLSGAMPDATQWLFLPGFALLLGYLRALSGNVWTTVGMHLAWMTSTQILGAQHGLFATGNLGTLQFLAFALLPSAVASTVLNLRRPRFDWRRRGG